MRFRPSSSLYNKVEPDGEIETSHMTPKGRFAGSARTIAVGMVFFMVQKPCNIQCFDTIAHLLQGDWRVAEPHQRDWAIYNCFYLSGIRSKFCFVLRTKDI